MKIRMPILVMLAGFIVTSPAMGVGGATPAAVELSFGIVPQQAASKLARLWVPVMRHLEQQTNIRLHFKTARDIPAFEQRLAEGAYDIAYMNPYHYTVYAKSPGYSAFAREKDRQLTGILVVHKDSPIKDIRDLEGQTLVFPSPAAFAASILTRGALKQAGITFETKYVASHDSVYLNVIRGIHVSGGGVMRTFSNLKPDQREKMRVLWKTDPYTSHAIAAHPRVEAEVVARLRQAMLAMNNDQTGRTLLQALHFNGLQEANDRDYDDIRRLGIELLN